MLFLGHRRKKPRPLCKIDGAGVQPPKYKPAASAREGRGAKVRKYQERKGAAVYLIRHGKAAALGAHEQQAAGQKISRKKIQNSAVFSSRSAGAPGGGPSVPDRAHSGRLWHRLTRVRVLRDRCGTEGQKIGLSCAGVVCAGPPWLLRMTIRFSKFDFVQVKLWRWSWKNSR